MKKYVKGTFEDYEVTDTLFDWAIEEIEDKANMIIDNLMLVGDDQESMDSYIKNIRDILKDMSGIIDEVANDFEEMRED